jgi:hypothetical protein
MFSAPFELSARSGALSDMHPDTAAKGNMHNVANFIPRIVNLAFIVQIRPSFFSRCSLAPQG